MELVGGLGGKFSEIGTVERGNRGSREVEGNEKKESRHPHMRRSLLSQKSKKVEIVGLQRGKPVSGEKNGPP